MEGCGEQRCYDAFDQVRGRALWAARLEAPGISVFLKDGEHVYHTYSTYERGLDMLNVAYHYMDLVPKGRDEAMPGWTAGSAAGTSIRTDVTQPGALGRRADQTNQAARILSRVIRAKDERPKILETVETGYRLAIDPDSLDAARFRRLVDEARGAAAPERSETLTAALALWRGPALADFTYEPFAQRTITALEEPRVEATEDRFAAELELGRDAQLIAELKRPYRHIRSGSGSGAS